MDVRATSSPCMCRAVTLPSPLRVLWQASALGAVLDVLVDTLTRGWLWGTALDPGWTVVPVFWEMVVFAFTHKVQRRDISDAARMPVPHGAGAGPAGVCATRGGRREGAAQAPVVVMQMAGAAWKDRLFVGAPRWVTIVMSNGFRSPAGAVAVAGLMGAPLWAWARR